MRARLSAGVLGVLILAGGCTSSGQPDGGPSSQTAPLSASSSTSSPAPDYRDLLISTADIPITGLRLKITSIGAGSTGTAGQFSTADGNTTVTDVISVFANADDAGIALNAAQSVAPQQVDSPQVRKLPAGQAITGTEAGQAVTIAVFTEGRAFLVLRFQSDPSTAISADMVDQVVAAQTLRIRQALH